MRVIDEVHLEMPYAGACKIRAELRRRTGGEVDLSRRCVAGLMEEMNVRPVCPKPDPSKPAKRASSPGSEAWTTGRAGSTT